MLHPHPSRRKLKKSTLNGMRHIQKIEFRCCGYPQDITVQENIIF